MMAVVTSDEEKRKKVIAQSIDILSFLFSFSCTLTPARFFSPLLYNSLRSIPLMSYSLVEEGEREREASMSTEIE